MANVNKLSKVARRWSFQLGSIGAALMTYLISDPWSLMTVWNMMPDFMKDRLHPVAVLFFPLIFFLAALVAMFFKQKGLSDDKDGGSKN
jgi:hypothetical protein